MLTQAITTTIIIITVVLFIVVCAHFYFQLYTDVILLFRNPSVTSTGTTLEKMSLMKLEKSTSPKLYL